MSETDYDANFETRQFPLSSVDSLWLVVQKFTAGEGLAHVFLSFGLKGAQPEFFSVSVEIRREQFETYNPIRGLYRTYEMTHVVGDERDLFGVRTIHRPHDRVYLYRINANAEQVQELFQKLVERIAKLNQAPEFYNSVLNNCANGITRLTYELTPEPINWLDPRIVLPGYSAEFAFEKELIGDKADGGTFSDLNESARIDLIAREAGISEVFSQSIRAAKD